MKSPCMQCGKEVSHIFGSDPFCTVGCMADFRDEELVERIHRESVPVATSTRRLARKKDWPTFWQSLTAQETADALRAAPRVAGEWVETSALGTVDWRYTEKVCHERHELSDGDVAVRVWESGQRGWEFQYRGRRHKFDTATEAKYAADEALVAQGWVLL